VCPECHVVIEDVEAGFCGECGATLPLYVPPTGEEKSAGSETGEHLDAANLLVEEWKQRCAEKEKEIDEFTREFEVRVRELGESRSRVKQLEDERDQISSRLDDKTKEIDEFEATILQLATSKKQLEVRLRELEATQSANPGGSGGGDVDRNADVSGQLSAKEREVEELRSSLAARERDREELVRVQRLLDAKDAELREKEKDLEVAILLKNEDLEKRERERVLAKLQHVGGEGGEGEGGEEEEKSLIKKLQEEVEFLQEENRNLEGLVEQLQLVGEETVLQLTAESESRLKELVRRAEKAESQLHSYTHHNH